MAIYALLGIVALRLHPLHLELVSTLIGPSYTHHYTTEKVITKWHWFQPSQILLSIKCFQMKWNKGKHNLDIVLFLFHLSSTSHPTSHINKNVTTLLIFPRDSCILGVLSVNERAMASKALTKSVTSSLGEPSINAC
jgi:hypothetical protein